MKRKEITKNSAKKRWSFSFFKKHRALSVSLVMIAAVIGSFLVINYGRYVKDIIEVLLSLRKNDIEINLKEWTISEMINEIIKVCKK